MPLGLIDHADALSAINVGQDAAVARDVTGALTPHVGRGLAANAHLLLPQIIDMHAHHAGELAAHWYDGIDPVSKFRAKAMTDIPREQIEKVVDWALHAPGEEPPIERLVGSSQRLVRNVSHQTITGNAAKEGVLWARYAKATACSFCRALAMRGSGREDRKYLYHSDKTAEFRKSDGEKYHTHCECEPVPIRGGQIWTPPDYTAEWTNQYNEAANATKAGPKYFQRVVAQMKLNEVPEPTDAEVQAADDELTHDDALKRLEAAKDVLAVEDIAREMFPDMDYISLRSPTAQAETDLELAKGVVRALDDYEQLYPQAMPGNVHVAPNPIEGVLGATFRMEGASTIRMSSRWMTDPEAFREAADHAVAVGFHYPGTDNPAYDTMIHELGHVMQDAAENIGVQLDDRDVRYALMDFYINNYPDPTEDGYTKWLRANLSGYSIMEGHRGVGGIPTPDTDEAIAEAFADTFINDDNAQTSSKVLTLMLVNALAGQDYTSTDEPSLAEAATKVPDGQPVR